VITDSGKVETRGSRIKFAGEPNVLTVRRGGGMDVVEGLSGEDRERVMMIEGRVLKPEDRIHDLVDILDAVSGFREEAPRERRDGPEIIYDLVDVVEVVERKPRMALVDTGLHDEIMKRAQEIAEKVAREIIPDIAERVIREEIEKLKKGV
jgi:hypothetical protein